MKGTLAKSARAVSTLVGTTTFVLATTGCLDRDLKPVTPCTVSGTIQNVQVNNVEKVDVLFMVDNSNSMAEEQANLAAEFPRLVDALASGNIDEDETTQEFPPVKDLHVGVISSDMGTGGYAVSTCDEPNYGDDGVLLHDGHGSGCAEDYPRFLTFMPDAAGADANQFKQDFSCIAVLGTGGCGFEQQLEAVLKAIVPRTCDATYCQFHGGTAGHGDGENDGFIREDSLLAIIMVTDEEDCSASDPEIFSDDSTTYTGNPNLKCFLYPDAVYPFSRYVDGYLSLRAERPDLLVFAAITGVPEDLTERDDEGNPLYSYDQILSDPRMIPTIDTESAMPRLVPSCNTTNGVAYPPVRIVQVAEGLDGKGANSVVQSICADDFRPALSAIIDKIADVLSGACLDRELVVTASGTVDCDVVEILPAEGDGEITACSQLADRGREFARIEVEQDGTQREVCRIQQVPVFDETPEAGLTGWYYDSFSASKEESCGEDGQRISFTEQGSPVTGSRVRMECLQPVSVIIGSGESTVYVGKQCSGQDDCAGSDLGDLTCDAELNTCQLSCESDAECPSSFVCDQDREVNGQGAKICVNPTCG